MAADRLPSRAIAAGGISGNRRSRTETPGVIQKEEK